MAKHFTSVVIEGRSLAEVERCLESIVGPLLHQWRRYHLLGVHLDISDVSDAVRYGMEFENQDAPRPSYPVVEVDLYASSDAPVRALKEELAGLIASALSEKLRVTVEVRQSES